MLLISVAVSGGYSETEAAMGQGEAWPYDATAAHGPHSKREAHAIGTMEIYDSLPRSLRNVLKAHNVNLRAINLTKLRLIYEETGRTGLVHWLDYLHGR